MLYETSLPIVIVCLVGGVGSFYLWMQYQQKILLGLSILSCVGASSIAVLDYVVETDREYLQSLFPKLAQAVEKQEYDTVLEVLDPELHHLRREVREILDRTHPQRVLITYLDVTVNEAAMPPSAVVDSVMRVATSSSDSPMDRDILADIRVLLQKKAGVWRIIDAKGRRPGFGQQ